MATIFQRAKLLGRYDGAFDEDSFSNPDVIDICQKLRNILNDFNRVQRDVEGAAKISLPDIDFPDELIKVRTFVSIIILMSMTVFVTSGFPYFCGNKLRCKRTRLSPERAACRTQDEIF